MPERERVPGEDEALETLVLRYLELTENGEQAQLAEICADRPELLPALEEVLGHVPGGEDPWIDRILGDRYRIESRIGAGGMGLVFGARDLELERDVAVKILEDAWSQDPERRARFLREARTVASIDDPGIVAIHDASFDSTPPFVVFERIDGSDLAHWIAELRAKTPMGELPRVGDGERPWAEIVARMGIAMARTLAVAHDGGVLHRDIKPANFMREPSGRIRLLDFGLARRDQDPGLTRSSASVGSPLYMPPELLRGRNASTASDVYSLGATLYELACLSPAFDGHGRELEQRILHDEAPPLHERCCRLPRALSAIVHRCLAKDPTKRYDSASALAADLQRFVDFEPIEASKSWWPKPMRRTIASWRRHKNALRAVAGIAIVSTVAALVWSQVRGESIARASDARNRELASLHARLSPTLGLDGQRSERLRDPTRATQLDLLRRIAELEDDAAPARDLLRLVRAEEGEGAKAAPAASWTPAFELLRNRRTNPKGTRAAAKSARLLCEQLLARNELPSFLKARLLGFANLESAAFAETLRIAREHEAQYGVTALSSFLKGAALAALDRDRARSLEALDEAKRLCPGHAPTIFMRARQLRRLHRPKEALDDLLLVLAQRPGHVVYRELEVLILRDLADAAGAESDEARDHRATIEERLRSWPDSERERGLLVTGNYRLWRALRANADSIAHLDAALAAFGSLAEARSARIRLAAQRNATLASGLRAGDQRMYFNAIWRRLLERPRDAVLLRNLSQALGSLPPDTDTRAEQAALLLAQAMASEPDNLENSFSLIRVLTSIDPELALEQIVRCTNPEQHRQRLLPFAKKNLDLLDLSRWRIWRGKLRNAGIGGRP